MYTAHIHIQKKIYTFIFCLGGIIEKSYISFAFGSFGLHAFIIQSCLAREISERSSTDVDRLRHRVASVASYFFGEYCLYGFDSFLFKSLLKKIFF